MAKMVNQPKFLLVLLAVPALLYILIIASQGFFGDVSIPTEDGKIVYGKFLFPCIMSTRFLPPSPSLRHVQPVHGGYKVLDGHECGCPKYK